MAFNDVFLDELRSKNDIENLIGGYVSLKRNGRTLKGLCPFHNEKTPSFTVYPDTQSYYCFGCGAGGDAITFVRQIENLDYMEAVKFLADRAGMRMPEEGYDDSLGKRRRRIYEMNRCAAKFYYDSLVSPENKGALDYFLSRGLTPATIKHFGLGYAPDSWDSLLKHLTSLGYSRDEIFAANLCRKGRNGGCYDNFRNRVMFPIIDLRGNVIGFGGRVLDDDSKLKYINTSDTMVYKKTGALFALNFAKNETDGTIILCEGYMDAISLHQAGFKNAIASCGTALTLEQARIISRYASEVVLSQDADEPGRKAVEKSIDIFSKVGIKVRVLNFSGAKDPDEFIKKFGADRFKGLLEVAANDIEYRILQQRSRFDLSTSDGKTEFLKSVAKVISTLPSPIDREVYAGKISEEMGVDKQAIISQANTIYRARAREKQKRDIKSVIRGDSEKDRINPEKLKNKAAAAAEERIISVLLNNNDLYPYVKENLSCDDFVTTFNRRIFTVIANRLERSDSVEISSLSGELTTQEIGVCAGLLATGKQLTNCRKECEDSIAVLKQQRAKLDKPPADQLGDEEFKKLFANN